LHMTLDHPETAASGWHDFAGTMQGFDGLYQQARTALDGRPAVLSGLDAGWQEYRRRYDDLAGLLGRDTPDPIALNEAVANLAIAVADVYARSDDAVPVGAKPAATVPAS